MLHIFVHIVFRRSKILDIFNCKMPAPRTNFYQKQLTVETLFIVKKMSELSDCKNMVRNFAHIVLRRSKRLDIFNCMMPFKGEFF